MTVRKLLSAVSLLLLARLDTAQLLYDSLDELDDGSLNGSVSFSGKTAFSR
jgi:hypothetical protein